MAQPVSDILPNNPSVSGEISSVPNQSYGPSATERISEVPGGGEPEIGGEQGKEGALSPSWLLMFFLLCINELIDYIGLLLNATGVWEIIIIIIDLCCAAIFFLWRHFLAPKTGKGKLTAQIILIIAEHIPIVGDILPGWIITMFMYM